MTRTAEDRFFARIDALERGRATTPKVEKRYSMAEYLANVYSFNGNTYLPQTTWQGTKSEPIGPDFTSLVQSAYKRNGVVFACVLARALLFSEMVFKFRNKSTSKLYGSPALAPLERPGVNQSTGELLFRMEQDGSLAGNWFGYRSGPDIRRMRPDWTQIILASDTEPEDPSFGLDCRVAGYLYGAPGSKYKPRVLLPEQVAHWSPIPDPEAHFRGMSWVGVVLREIVADGAATDHKTAFFDNAATPNMVIKFPESVMKREQFTMLRDAMEESHGGNHNAFKTLYLAAGADATVVGSSLKDIDFRSTQGAGETRIAIASRVPAVVLGISEGLGGSSLNTGNYGQARRQLADGLMRPNWRSACTALASMVQVPADSELWHDPSRVAWLQEDEKDAAEITSTKAQAMRQLTDGGFEPQSVVDAVNGNDMSLLKHTGLLPVQVQAPGAQNSPTPPKADPPKPGA